MKKVFLLGAVALLTGTAAVSYVNAQPPTDDLRAQVAKEDNASPMGKEMRERGRGLKEGHERNEAGSEVPDHVRKELKDYHEKKKTLREGLSPEAKDTLKKRHERRKERKEKVHDKMEKHEETREHLKEKAHHRKGEGSPAAQKEPAKQ